MMIDFREKATVGGTSVSVTRLGLGSAALGYLYEPVDESEAIETIQTAYENGISFYDTAVMYGAGLAEARIGGVLSRLPRDSFTLATKIGYVVPATPSRNSVNYDLLPRDYSYDGTMRSLEASLKRLQLDRIDIVHIHDADDHYDEAIKGAYKALSELRSQGVIRAVGAGMNQSAMLTRFAQEGEFDCFLMAGRYTLLDQTALIDLMPVAEQTRISIFIGGPLNSGILADPYAANPMFNYGPAAQEWVEKARKLDTVCRRYEVPLKAAALQFSLAHPAVASVLTGARSQKELSENIQMVQFPIPTDLWQDLKREGLLAEDVPVPVSP